MKKVVIDTNVFVSSFFGGNPLKIINLWKKGEIFLCVSNEILEEYINVLIRMGLKNEKELGELLNLFRRNHNLIFAGKTPKLKIVKDDPDDNKFIECAVELGAQCIISGDKHLLRLKKYFEIEILKPKDFLDKT